MGRWGGLGKRECCAPIYCCDVCSNTVMRVCLGCSTVLFDSNATKTLMALSPKKPLPGTAEHRLDL